MARGDRNKVRWAKDRQRKKKERDKRHALDRGQARKGK
jgi:hypothetical protein